MDSTVLDAVVCLLLVSAAAMTVGTAGGAPEANWTGGTGAPPAVDRADAVAATLASATTTVNYTLAPGARAAGLADTAGPEFERTTSGTYAGLLARAVVASVRIDGAPVSPDARDFLARTAGAVGSVLPARTQVRVRWRPVPGSGVDRRLTLGPSPPADASVHAAELRVPARGVPAAGRTERMPTVDGLAVAVGLVEVLFPPDRVRFALADDPPVPGLVRYRYRRAADRLGVREQVAEALADRNVEAANRALADALAVRVGTSTADTNGHTTRTVGPVRIVVRTWAA